MEYGRVIPRMTCAMFFLQIVHYVFMAFEVPRFWTCRLGAMYLVSVSKLPTCSIREKWAGLQTRGRTGKKVSYTVLIFGAMIKQ